MPSKHNPPLEIRLRVLSAVDHAPGESIRARIRHVATLTFTDQLTGQVYPFTWRTISTWLYRFKRYGVATLENKPRADKDQPRKVSISQLAEAIHEVLPLLSRNKSGVLPKSVLYRLLLQKGFFARSQLAPTTFYRHIREHDLLKETVSARTILSSTSTVPAWARRNRSI